MAAKERYDNVFLLYNEQEKGPEAVVDALRERGITVYFFRTDFPVGGEILSGEAARLEAARAVMVLLGQHGWGPTQREIAHRAESLQKPMIPVLIGEPPETAFEEVGGMFRRRRWIDLRKPTSNAHDGLARAVRQVLGAEPLDSPEQGSPRFDEIIKTLVDGSEADRSALLERIRRDGVTDRNGLAARLRSSIQEDFSPSQEGRFAAAIRDPKRLASTRSWMLSVLIWMEPLSRESVELILEHIRPEHEPDRAVRFWTLAGIIQAQLPYLGDAIGKARDDPSPEVSGLAAIASDPDNDFTLNDFRLWVSSEHFETAWRVLRIIRIYPVPALAGEVVAQLERWAENKALTYDALFALASREMALAARPIILEKVGLRRFTQLIIRESRGSTPVSVTAFARVLSVFDRQQVRSALREAAADAEDRQVVRGILDDIAETLSDVSEGEPPSPGHAPEKIDISKDDIGITRDVQTLASVMLARDVDPPLAIGLFGEWGSGKSFYIKSIEAAVNDIATRATSQGQNQFCSRIVQIHFNAWHYVDTSLWASLVTHMLDGLSAHLAPQQSPAEQRAALARDLASARSEIELAKSEQMLAATQLEKTTKDLQEKILVRERSEVKLRDLRAADLLALLHDQGELDTTLRSALKDVGAPAALESIAELNKVVEESYSTAGRCVALLVSLVKSQNILIVFVGIILFFAAPPLIMLGVEWILNEYAATISASIAKATVAAGSVTLILRLALEKAKLSLDALSRAKRKVDEQLATKRLTPSKEEEELQEKVTGARASEKAAAERVAAATARAQELEGRVATLEDSQSLGYFIAERSRSEDYRRHLGLISMIRKDFDGLVDRIRGARSGEKGIDRIILYIDDVDRCPPHMVVDILQAVHLLLAYELFVVVLSVDPRWLLRSLETRMTQLQTDGSTIAEGMSATPQDYLEKIFQIPFSVRPMGKHGFGRLMRRLFAPSVEQLAATPLQPEQLEPREAGRSSPAQLPAPRTPTGGAKGVMQTPPVQPPSPVVTASVPETATSTDLNVLADVLVISPVEAEFSQKLHFLLPTPRSAKRFVNIYRLLKASLPRGELARFEGTQGVPGDFQLPMLLIALLVGQSTIAGGLFPQLLTRAREGRQDWWQTAWATRPLSAQEAWLREQLDEVVGAFYFPHSPDLVVLWLPQVARYSFNTAKIFLEER